MHGVEWNGYVLFAHSEETSDADYERSGFPVALDEHVHDFADLVIGRIIDALLVPVSDRDAVRRNAAHDLRSPGLGSLRACNGRDQREQNRG